MRRAILWAALAATFFATTDQADAVVYHTSLSATVNNFAAYDEDTNTWTQLNPFKTGSTFAVSASGDMFAYSGDRTAILKYNATNDTWNHHISAPTLVGSHDASVANYFNLEITNSGRFLLTGSRLDRLYYSDGGAWSSTPLDFQTNATGDYDPTTGKYAITPSSGASPKLIDPVSFAVTNFSGSGIAGDWRRSGTILDGSYYSQTSVNDVEQWDLSDPSASPVFITSTPTGLNWMGSTADRDHGYLYATDYLSSAFYRYDGTSWTALANVNSSSFNHTTIAYVSDLIPEPTSLLVWLLLGAVGTCLWRRKRIAA